MPKSRLVSETFNRYLKFAMAKEKIHLAYVIINIIFLTMDSK